MDAKVLPKLETELSVAAADWLDARLVELQEQGKSRDESSKAFDPEMYLLDRIAGFRFDDYPSYTAPWHLLRWPHMRWEHVYHVVTLVEMLKQATGANVGAPIKLDPFQIFILLCFLGPEDPDTGLRLVTEGLLTLARKQGKTVIVGALVLALMTIHPDNYGLFGQEIQVGAADREQAGITFKIMSRMILQDQDIGIKEKFHTIPSKKYIQHKSTLTEFHAVSSEAFRAHGSNSVIVLMDEIGNIASPLAREFYSVLTSGFGAQKEPLTLMLSTQAPTDEHFFSQQVDRAKRINEGLLEDPSFAGFVFTLPEQDEDGVEFDPWDERWWHLAAPGIGTIYSLKDMKDWAKKARDLPDLENKYRNLKLNQRVSMTSGFLSRKVWKRNSAAVDPADLYGRRCWAGIDLAETTDLAALVLLFEPLPGSIQQAVMPFFWIPGEGLEARSDRDKVPYTTWSKQGLIDTQSSEVVDYERIADKLEELARDYDIQALGVDRWRWKQLELALKDKDVEFGNEDKENPTLFIIGQGYRDAPTSIELIEKDALEARLAHGDNPILTWNIANTVTVKDPAGNRKADKSKSYGRIDGTIALMMARRARHEQELIGPEESMYNDMNRAVIM